MGYHPAVLLVGGGTGKRYALERLKPPFTLAVGVGEGGSYAQRERNGARECRKLGIRRIHMKHGPVMNAGGRIGLVQMQFEPLQRGIKLRQHPLDLIRPQDAAGDFYKVTFRTADDSKSRL